MTEDLLAALEDSLRRTRNETDDRTVLLVGNADACARASLEYGGYTPTGRAIHVRGANQLYGFTPDRVLIVYCYGWLDADRYVIRRLEQLALAGAGTIDRPH